MKPVNYQEMADTVNISRLIVLTPDVCGGRPRIDGSRITVQYVVNEIKAGITPEEIVEDKPLLVILVLVYFSKSLFVNYSRSIVFVQH